MLYNRDLFGEVGRLAATYIEDTQIGKSEHAKWSNTRAACGTE